MTDDREEQYRRAWEQEIAAGKKKERSEADEAADKKVQRELNRDVQDKKSE